MAADAVVQMEYFMVAKYQHWGTTRGREWLVLAQCGNVGFFRETRQLGSLCPKDYLFSEYCVFFSHLFFQFMLVSLFQQDLFTMFEESTQSLVRISRTMACHY